MLKIWNDLREWFNMHHDEDAFMSDSWILWLYRKDNCKDGLR